MARSGIVLVVFPRGLGGGVALQLDFLRLKLVEIELLLCCASGSAATSAVAVNKISSADFTGNALSRLSGIGLHLAILFLAVASGKRLKGCTARIVPNYSAFRKRRRLGSTTDPASNAFAAAAGGLIAVISAAIQIPAARWFIALRELPVFWKAALAT